ncbi:MAG: nitronate monooxygenase [Anaerolineales bacterium]|nr:nitronate monooxygenase [Anaerolineales bacterium]
MRFQTRITDLFGIETPIIGGCMMHISGAELVAAISNSGALGIMASAMFPSQEEFRRAVQLTKELTQKPFGVNLSLFPALRPIDNTLYLEVILEEGVPVVVTSGQRPPEDMLATLKDAGIKTMHKCVNVRHALSAQKAGVDAVALFGSEGGGHIGDYGLSTFILVPRAVEVLDIPVLAAGGIADGRGLAAALALGADGVVIGTRLLVTRECPIHENLKEALLNASELDTMPVLGSLHNSLRAWKNQAALRVAEIEAGQGDMSEILALVAGTETKEMIKGGDVDRGVIACSQGIGIVHEVVSVEDVISGMVVEAEEIFARYME